MASYSMSSTSGLHGLESPLQSFARRHNQTSTYRNATAGLGGASNANGYHLGTLGGHTSNGGAAPPLQYGEEEAADAEEAKYYAQQQRSETRRQLDEELNYVDKQRELELLQDSINAEQHALANRRVFLKDREASLLEAQRALEAQQAALRLEISAFEAEQQRAAEEQRRLDLAAESLHDKQSQLNDDIKRRRDNKSQSHQEAQRYVAQAQDASAFNALNDALRHGASLGVLRAIVEVHIGGVDQQNAKYNQWTPLHYAAWHGHDALCELLVANNADIDAMDTYSHYTPLDWAMSRHQDYAARFLASVGAKRGVAIAKEVSFALSASQQRTRSGANIDTSASVAAAAAVRSPSNTSGAAAYRTSSSGNVEVASL